MLKKVEKNKKLINKKTLSVKTAFPNSKKIYINSKKFKNVNVPMREISLSDNEIKNIVVYDTSGSYSDPNINHDYESGLQKLRQEWIKTRAGISLSKKENLKFLNHSKTVEPFPNITQSIFKKKGKDEITQLFYARNNIITEEMEFCAIRENEGREQLIGEKFKKKIEVVNTNGSGFSQNKSNFILANSNGFIDGYKSSNFSAYCEVVAKSNGSMERDYEYSSKRFFKDLLEPKKIGEKASELAIKKLKPRKIKSKKMKVIFDKRIAKNFLSSFASAISSGTIAKGTTFLKNKLNTEIFNKKINIIDKPDIVKGSGSRYFDIEGTSTNKLSLVENGVLKNYFIDTYNGKKINMKSNGRASGTTNLYFENGDEDYKNLINSDKEILYINETFGRGANIITGDYSVGASGFMVENGEFIYPVSEITIAGDLNHIFNKMVLGNDLQFIYSTNSPTMLVDELTVGGK